MIQCRHKKYVKYGGEKMYKRISIRIVNTLSEDLSVIAKKRGLSINSLISEMAWDFVEVWKEKHKETSMKLECPYPANPVGVGKEE